MTNIVYGDRVGIRGRLLLGVSASIFDSTGQKMLLTRRYDNGRWCVPGGAMEPGESVAEACYREVWEETGLEVRVIQLVGVYSTPHIRLEHPSGNVLQIVVLHFLVEVISGEPGVREETREVGYFSQAEIADMDVVEVERPRIEDAFADQPVTFIR